jgi:hypothetical protein
MEDEEILPLKTKEFEFCTSSILRIEDDYFRKDEDGGSIGSHGNYDIKTLSISRQEARRLLIEWGCDIVDIARWTR